MITEQQQEQGSLYALGALTEEERRTFEAELRSNLELRDFVLDLQRTANVMVLALPKAELPAGMKDRLMQRIDQGAGPSISFPTALAGLRFQDAAARSGWKQLPVPGAFVKVLSIERERGYAVLLGKLDPGVRYPAHVNAGPEDFYILSGDLVIGDRKLLAGDFHHADAGSQHAVNYSVEGCTLLAVLTTNDPLVEFAMA
jgi:anti-sigma factor ChrR (cupin superfamily)